MLVIGVSPIIAPTAGGYITATIGWHYVFAVLTIVAAVILISVYFLLPHSKKPDRNVSLKPKAILKNFLTVFKEPQFFTYALAGAIASSGLYAYIAGSPYVFMEMYKVSEKQYGWIFAFNAIGLIGASQLNSVALRKFKSEQIIKAALFWQVLAGVTLFILNVLGAIKLYSIISLIFIFLCCQGFIFPNTSALSLAPFVKNAGSASAMLGTIQMTVGTLSSALVSILANNTALPMSGVMASCALVSFCILLMGRRIIRYRANNEDVKEETAEMLTTL
jgi:DHA1 family bicyclomycin/chloramphenicol resistance-like MFS transporter